MKSIKRILRSTSLAILFITISASPISYGADFTLRAPIKLTNMPSSVTHVIVRCLVMCIDDAFSEFGGGNIDGMRDIFLRTASHSEVVGIGTTTRSINTATGRLQQTLTINVNTSPGRWPNSAESYACAFKLRTSRGQQGFPGQQNSAFSLPSGVTVASQINNLVAIGAFNNPAQNASECDGNPNG